MKLLHAPQTSATSSVGSLLQQTATAESSTRLQLRLKPTTQFRSLHISSVGRSKIHRLQAAPDGIAPENAEAKAREQMVEKAKAEAASGIDEIQEPFRGSVESGETIGEATTNLQFENSGDARADAEQQIHNTNKQLLTPNGKGSGDEKPSKEEGEAEVASEVWSSKDNAGSTHAFVDDERKMEFHGQDDESVLGVGGQRAAENS